MGSRSSRQGGQRYPMAAHTSVRRRTGTVDLSKAVNHRGPAFLAPGRHDRNTIRLEVYFFLATRANRIAGRWAINDRLKRLLPGLVRLPPRLWSTSQTPRVPSDPHRCIDHRRAENQSRSAQEALELAPTATSWRVQGRQSLRQLCGADPESGAHLSHLQPKSSASSADWRQITPRSS
jgi:hypothetical protein